MPDHDMPQLVGAGEAPGRVNLIGEHTDYHEGLVLPTAIPQTTRVTARRRTDTLVRARSNRIHGASGGGSYEEFRLGDEQRGRGWLDYVQGVTATLRAHRIALSGFDLEIDSDVPIGAGVSSSAALEVATLRALRSLLDLELDDRQVARFAHQTETEFVGAPVGIMDQMAVSLCRQHEALFIDTRTLVTEPIAIPDTIDLLVIHSGVTHAHTSGGYSARRQESFDAAARLGIRYLRDADLSWMPRIEALPPLLARRARHVVTENARVVEAVAALRSGDVERLGVLFAASQVSMRDDYEITTPEIDTLVQLAGRNANIYGARMTGGGFGGAVVMLAAAGTAAAAAREICPEYTRITGVNSQVLVPSRL